MSNLENIKVGRQEKITEEDAPVNSVLLINVLKEMEASDNLRVLTEKIRAAKTKDERDRLKKRLPAIIVSADTTSRKVSPDDKRTGLIYIDLDLKDHPGTDLEKLVDSMDYPWLIGYQQSPSGGLKALCGIEQDAETHLRSFKALDQVFSEHGLSVDQSCKDLKRVTFLCHDPDIEHTLIEPLKEWTGERITPASPVERKKFKSNCKLTTGMNADDEAGICLEYLDPDIDYHDWLTVGMALKAHGASLSVWDRWSAGGESYKPGECERKWESFTGSGVNFGTVVALATDVNGGRNPIIAEKNEMPVVTADSCEVVDNEHDEAPVIFRYKNDYWILDQTGERYIPLNETHLTRRLRSMGYSTKGEDGAMSAIDRIKDDAIYCNTLDFCSVIAGRPIGIKHDDNDKRYLIPSKNKRIKVKAGDCPTIRSIIEGMLKDQAVYFYSWLHVSRKQLNREQYIQGHVLALSGEPNCGKSLCAEVMVRPLLGRSADPTKYLTGSTDFNADLVAAELLLMDDKGGGRSAKERHALGQNLKWISAGSHTVSCHPKGVDAYNLNPLWRCLICMNDDEQSIGAFPPLGEGDCDSIGDKVLLLKCFKETLPFAGDNRQSQKLSDAISTELPAFAYFVDNYEIPAEIQKGDCRLGFDEYHHPELLVTLNQNSNERTLLSATDEIFFGDNEYAEVPTQLDQTTKRYYWTGTADQWSQHLRNARGYGAYGTINANLAFGDTSAAASKWLGKIKKVADGRVIGGKDQKVLVDGKRGWRIWAPIGEVDDDGNHPF